jgi:flagella basal body P-ring formation protein FlgA
MVSVKPAVVIDGPTLHLGDIFAGAGARAEVVVGTSPAPGRRLVVEAAQLAALARMHGLAWRPLMAGERSIIERPGRPVPQDEVVELLRAELMRLGMPAESELELPNFAAPLVPVAALLNLGLEGLVFDAAQGRFAATLVVLAEGQPSQRLRIAGRAMATVPVVVATRRMAMGDVIRAADVRLARLRVERVRPGAAEAPDQVVGQQLRRPMTEGFPVMTGDLGPPPVVAKNALVVMTLDAPGLSLTMQGRALADAPQGGVLQVMNLESHAVVEALATGPGRVRVAMGAVPIIR